MSKICKNSDITKIFDNCKNILNIKSNIILLESPTIKTPFTFGLFKTFIVLPNNIILPNLSKNDLKYILLHELSHYKNKDIIINYILCVLQSLYWFNPIILITFTKMRTDRKIICDISVLKKIGEENCINYGNTIINFINQISSSSVFNLISNIGGNKTQIKRRIEKIAGFSIKTNKTKINSILIFLITVIFIFVQVPFIFAYGKAHNTSYDFKNSNVILTDLSSYFNNIKNGCFVLYDTKSDIYMI